MSDFRKSIFNLCNNIKKQNNFEDIRNTMASLLLKFDNSQENIIELKKEVASNGVKLNKEFFGVLLAFEKKLSAFPNIKNENVSLSDKEYQTLYFGHFCINTFVCLCLEDIKKINSNIAEALHPYSLCVPLESNSIEFDYDMTIFNEAIKTFKETSIYKDITKSNILNVLKIPEKEAKNLIYVLENNILKINMDIVPDEIHQLKIKELDMKHGGKKITTVEAITIMSYKLIALREMLCNAIKLLYNAILGLDLIVVNEDNLINIEENKSNFIYQYKTVLTQDIIFKPFCEIIKDIVLVDIDCGHSKIHEFGIVRNLTLKFGQDEGSTTKISYCVIDEELNPIFSLTK